jgi:N-acetylglucosaminyl-diphospho-decaprenol L-rhamnosyltransferase
MELSIIFVNWNSTDYLQQCIESIYAYTAGFEFEIIVVDNASPLADVDLLTKAFEKITLIKSTVNLGFAGANNVGFKRSSGRYLLFLNPDTKLIGPALVEMRNRLKSLPDAGVVGCKLLNDDRSIQTSCIQSFPTLLNQALDTEALRQRWPDNRLWGMGPLFSDNPDPAKVEVISGACMMIRREVFEQVGLFSEDYFMYAEDLDLCYKVAQAGYVNYYISEATVIHYGGKSSTPSTATVTKWNSMLQYFVKNRGIGYALLFRAIMSVAAVCRLALLALAALYGKGKEDRKGDYSASMKWRAILATLVTHSGTASQESTRRSRCV